MLTRSQYETPTAITRLLKSNEPLLVNQPGMIWQVQSGSLALFAVRVDQDQPRGKRR